MGEEKAATEDSSPSGSLKKDSAAIPSLPDSPGNFSSKVLLQQAQVDLRHSDPRVRTLALQYLEKLHASVALPLLQEALSDQNPEVRTQALSSLVRFHNPALNPLFRKFLRDDSPTVRITALRGMFQCQERIDLNILLQLMSDESPWVRRKMATLLGWTPIEGVLPILVQMSNDQEQRVRKAALFSLVTLYPEEGEDRLVKAMTDPDPDLRKWAKKTLEKRLSKPGKETSSLPAKT